uniref:Uncharacterized protein n=1 Tax=Trichuris muris TaxID=70415 RepID=A0A5S6QVE6_TRIMR
MGSNWVNAARSCQRLLSYVQGQLTSNLREYFYFIDQHGQLFLDDAKMKNFTSCFKDKQFLSFFFKRLKCNHTGAHEEEFPYVSFCGTERNFVRCYDRPIVYNEITGGLDETIHVTQHRKTLLSSHG